MRLILLGGASLGAMIATVPAFAQDAESATNGADQATVQAPSNLDDASTAKQGEPIIVTGSRIVRRDYTSASPIVTTSSAALADTGDINIHESLAQLPQFSPGQPSGRNAGGAGRNTVDLRGLGASRNLVLLDGRRLPPSNLFGVIDTNIIPQAIVESVETISGGASAVYGSDAISGVVNFRTKSRFDGVELRGQYGNTFKTDRMTLDTSLTTGLSGMDDRAHAILTLSYSEVGGLDAVKRPFYDYGVLSSYIAQGTFIPDATNLPSQAAVDSQFGNYAAGKVSPTSRLGFNDDGSLFTQNGALNYAGPTDGYWSLLGNTVRMPVSRQGQISTPRKRFAAFSKFDYELTDALTAYAQVLYVDSRLTGAGGYSLTQFAIPTISASNPFIPDSLRTLLDSRPDPTADFTINRRFWELPTRATDTQFNTSEFLIGLRGNLPFGDWTFDGYASRDRTTVDQEIIATLASRLQDLWQAPDGGASICQGGYNPFGMANAMQISAECQDYLTDAIKNNERIAQDNYELAMQGGLFSLPAGGVRASVVVAHRDNSFSFSPDSQLIAGNVEAIVATNPTAGHTSVNEIGGELFVPLLKDIPFIQELNFTGGLRYSDYNLSGGATTYKGELEWVPTAGILLRGGYQRAIRAPNIGELFSAPTGGQVEAGNPPAGGDPCDVRGSGRNGANASQLAALCLATGVPSSLLDTFTYTTTGIAIQQSGNVDLKPETATSKTAGIVVRPDFNSPWLSRLSFSIDYYSIKIDDVISTISGITVLAKCYNQDGSNAGYDASNPYCQLIQRDQTGGIGRISLPYLNLGGLETSGIDFQFDWGLNLADAGIGNLGEIRINAVATYTDSYKSKALPDSDFQELAGTISSADTLALPKWRWLMTTTYETGPISASLRWRHVDGMNDVTSVTRPSAPAPGVPSYDIFDLTARVNITDDYTLRAGVTNLFDKQPYKVAGVEGSTLSGTYDIYGRSFYVGLNVKF